MVGYLLVAPSALALHIMKLTQLCLQLGLAFSLLTTFGPHAAAQEALDSWGDDAHGQVSEAPSIAGFAQVASGGFHSLGLHVDGTVHSWGRDDWGQVSNSPAGSSYIQVAGGGFHSLALRLDGSIEAWGRDTTGQVSNAPTGTGFTQVEAGDHHSIALHSNGSIVSWGWDGTGQVSSTPSGTGFTQVASGGRHSLALRADGSILSWGANPYTQVTGTPAGVGFSKVAGGGESSLALRMDGSLVRWGRAYLGQFSSMPTGLGYTEIAVGAHNSFAIAADGSIAAWGDNSSGGVSFAPEGIGFTDVSGGFDHALALQDPSIANTGNAYCFGDGSGTTCPCMNGSLGAGCANSAGATGATLRGLGNAFLSVDTFRLSIDGIPGNKPGLILRGATQTNAGLGLAVGDGLLCTGGQSARSQVQLASAGSTLFTDFQGMPFGASSYGAGVPTNYQFWYRNTTNSCSGAGFNFSNAWTTTWLP